MSQNTSDFSWLSFLKYCTTFVSVVLILRSGLLLKVSLQDGQKQVGVSVQCLFRQVLQKLCPHGVVTGSVNTSRQMEHWSSSFSGSLEDAMPEKISNDNCLVQIPTLVVLATSEHVRATGIKCARLSQVLKMPKHSALNARLRPFHTEREKS